MLGGPREINAWFLMQVFMLTQAIGKACCLGFTLHWDILFSPFYYFCLLPVFDYLCQDHNALLNGNFWAYAWMCKVSLFCCFSQVWESNWMWETPIHGSMACMGGSTRSAKHQLIRFCFCVAKSGVLTDAIIAQKSQIHVPWWLALGTEVTANFATLLSH